VHRFRARALPLSLKANMLEPSEWARRRARPCERRKLSRRGWAGARAGSDCGVGIGGSSAASGSGGSSRVRLSRAHGHERERLFPGMGGGRPPMRGREPRASAYRDCAALGAARAVRSRIHGVACAARPERAFRDRDRAGARFRSGLRRQRDHNTSVLRVRGTARE
jgi:hypothetical protein